MLDSRCSSCPLIFWPVGEVRDGRKERGGREGPRGVAVAPREPPRPAGLRHEGEREQPAEHHGSVEIREGLCLARPPKLLIQECLTRRKEGFT